MRKAFLRAPVEFTRVSSVFNPHRLHPILNLIRGHMGTDYAAPIGTPVHAAGDGRVAFEGVRGGYGNAIVLSHSNEISDALRSHVAVRPQHPRRLARAAGRGHRLRGHDRAGDGAPLHYEYLMNGVHKDPQTVKLPGAEPLRADAMGEIPHRDRSDLASMRSLLRKPRCSKPVLAAPQPGLGGLTLGGSGEARAHRSRGRVSICRCAAASRRTSQSRPSGGCSAAGTSRGRTARRRTGGFVASPLSSSRRAPASSEPRANMDESTRPRLRFHGTIAAEASNSRT